MSSLLFLLFSAAAGENALACADLNRDGHPDIVVADERDARLTVWLGSRGGELTRDLVLSTAINPTDLAIADLDGDDRPDLVVAHHEADQVSVFYGDGAGQFDAPRVIKPDVSPHPHIVRLADLNADGAVDILVDDRNAGGVRVIQGHANRSFTATGQRINLGGDPYLGFSLGDLDGDGVLDIVAPVNRRATVTIRGTAKTDKPPAPFSPDADIFATALLDVNGDGKLDAVTASQAANVPARLFLGDGSGRLTDSGKAFRLSRGAKKIAVGDLDGDGSKEAVVVSWFGGTFILSGNQDLDASRYDAIKHPWGIAVCDLNGDGADDVVLTDGESDDAGVFFSTPTVIE